MFKFLKNIMKKAERKNVLHGLTVYGFLDAENGIGQAARSYVRSIRTTNMPIELSSIPINNEDRNLEKTINLTSQETDSALVIINADLICHLIDVRKKLHQKYNMLDLPAEMQAICKPYKKRIGCMFWELPVFPGKWARAFDEFDEIWVSSNFIKESMKSATDKPIRVIPLSVPINSLDPITSRQRLNLPIDKKIFLVTFDFNSYPERKNAIASVKAYCDAVVSEHGSQSILIVKCQGSNFRSNYISKLKDVINNRNDIFIVDETYSHEDMLNLQAATDVFVSLHRSEGFGLNIAECMSAGKIVIATGYSGNMDFMTNSNSMPIEFTMKRLNANDYTEAYGQCWAEPQHDDAVESIRAYLRGSDEFSEMSGQARNTISSNHSDYFVGKIMYENL
jgi:hypothetical protein